MNGFGFQEFPNFVEQGMRQQYANSDFYLLSASGPGHEVLRLRWKTRDGWEVSEAKVFKLNPSSDEIASWKDSIGYPGHAGTKWDYFKEDVRSWWRKL